MTAPAPAAATTGTLDGRVCFVSGGAGGLGRALCFALSRAGAVVLSGDVTPAAVEGAAENFVVDLRDADASAALLKSIHRDFGGLDIVINNAGTDVTAPVGDISVTDWDRILDVNLRAPFVLARTAFEVMDPRAGGAIVNIVSTAARRAWANAAPYHASKWGLLGLSHALHVEGRERNIRVTAIVTGGMRTPFLFDRFDDLDPGVLLDPADVANTVLFALSQPAGVAIPELMVMSTREGSWP